MNWYKFKSHISEKPTVDEFIKTVNSGYDELQQQYSPYYIYEKIDGIELFTYLNTADLQIARLFIDHFINYNHIAIEPSGIDEMTIKNERL